MCRMGVGRFHGHSIDGWMDGWMDVTRRFGFLLRQSRCREDWEKREGLIVSEVRDEFAVLCASNKPQSF